MLPITKTEKRLLLDVARDDLNIIVSYKPETLADSIQRLLHTLTPDESLQFLETFEKTFDHPEEIVPFLAHYGINVSEYPFANENHVLISYDSKQTEDNLVNVLMKLSTENPFIYWVNRAALQSDDAYFYDYVINKTGVPLKEVATYE